MELSWAVVGSWGLFASQVIQQSPEVPNTLQLQAEGLNKEVLDKYKVKRRSHHLYVAAARLWAAGMPFSQAFNIVKDAFAAVIAE